MMNLSKPISSGVTIATVTTIAAIGGAYLYYRGKNRIPDKWTAVGTVIELSIFPLKSGRGMDVQTLDCTELGVKICQNEIDLRDRCLVVYGADYRIKSGLTFPKLVLIETAINNRGEFVFTAPGQHPIVVKIPDSKQRPVKITLLKKEPCEAVDCGDEAAVWFSTYILGKPTGVRLGYHRGEYKRDLEKAYPHFMKAYRQFNNNCSGMYQNLTSYHLMTQPSVDALSKHLMEPVSAKYFRPNILVDGCDLLPYVEEDWDWVKIGDVVFRTARPTVRCALTSVNPDNGVMSKTKDPLTTLERTNNLKKPAHIKCDGKRGVMGIQLGIQKLGQIKVGDVVYVG